MLARFSISKLVRLANAAGTTCILLWLKERRVMLLSVTGMVKYIVIHCFNIVYNNRDITKKISEYNFISSLLIFIIN